MQLSNPNKSMHSLSRSQRLFYQSFLVRGHMQRVPLQPMQCFHFFSITKEMGKTQEVMIFWRKLSSATHNVANWLCTHVEWTCWGCILGSAWFSSTSHCGNSPRDWCPWQIQWESTNPTSSRPGQVALSGQTSCRHSGMHQRGHLWRSAKESLLKSCDNLASNLQKESVFHTPLASRNGEWMLMSYIFLVVQTRHQWIPKISRWRDSHRPSSRKTSMGLAFPGIQSISCLLNADVIKFSKMHHFAKPGTSNQWSFHNPLTGLLCPTGHVCVVQICSWATPSAQWCEQCLVPPSGASTTGFNPCKLAQMAAPCFLPKTIKKRIKSWCFHVYTLQTGFWCFKRPAVWCWFGNRLHSTSRKTPGENVVCCVLFFHQRSKAHSQK